MGVRFVGRIIAPRIEPSTPLTWEYTAGETIPKGAVVCKGESDGRIYLANCLSRERMPGFGYAFAAAEVGRTVQILQGGGITNVQRAEDFQPDDVLYVSTVDGKITRTPPE
ncbi:MAG: hypothetical protein ABIH46_02465 [Chloroflexota bacterium]